MKLITGLNSAKGLFMLMFASI